MSGPHAADLFRALGVMSEPPVPEHHRVADALGLPGCPDPSQYTDLFVMHLYPYASVYLGAEGMLGGAARDRIAGFWRALLIPPPAEPDHLASLLGLYAGLADAEGEERDAARRVLWHEARRALLHEHLLSWLPSYLDRVEALAPPTYSAWAGLLRAALAGEAAAAGPPDRISAHLRAAPPLSDPRREGPPAFLTGLLAPVRSGMILTRADLARAARDLGLGLRAGERRFALAALLSQAPEAVLAWLAAEAAARGVQHERHADVAGVGARFWAERAAATAALLGELRLSAAETTAGDLQSIST